MAEPSLDREVKRWHPGSQVFEVASKSTAVCRFARTAGRIAIVAASAMAPLWCAAQEVPGYPSSWSAYDAREVALLPRYCLFTLGFRLAKVAGGESQSETDAWYAHLGPTFHSLHHYCWGMMKTNRAVLLARDPTTRRFYLTDSIGEFDYVIDRAPDDFLLLPEILTRKGENLIRLGKGSLAVFDLERAISLKPDYWPAYAQLADHYNSIGDARRARESLQEGLAQAPDANGLKRRLGELNKSEHLRKPARP